MGDADACDGCPIVATQTSVEWLIWGTTWFLCRASYGSMSGYIRRGQQRRPIVKVNDPIGQLSAAFSIRHLAPLLTSYIRFFWLNVIGSQNSAITIYTYGIYALCRNGRDDGFLAFFHISLQRIVLAVSPSGMTGI